jgi:hypothetical protein
MVKKVKNKMTEMSGQECKNDWMRRRGGQYN